MSNINNNIKTFRYSYDELSLILVVGTRVRESGSRSRISTLDHDPKRWRLSRESQKW